MVLEKSANVKQEIIMEPKTFLQDARRKNWFWDYNEIFDSELSAHAKLVRLYLARCANGDRQAWPSLNTIARHCGISKPTVVKVIKELEEKGWLRKFTRVRPNQEYESTVYVLEDPPASRVSEDQSTSEGDGKSPLPPVKNETGEARGVVKDVYHLVNQIDNLVKQLDSNNTQITIPREQEEDQLVISSLRSDITNCAPALRAECAAAVAHAEEISSDSHPRAGEADETATGGKEKRVNDGSGISRVTNKELIAELVSEYRSVDTVEAKKGDYAFIGGLYNRHGYEQVLEAVHELSLAAAVQEIRKPLLYLKAILDDPKKGHTGKINKMDREEAAHGSGMNDWPADKQKKRELLKSLYLA